MQQENLTDQNRYTKDTLMITLHKKPKLDIIAHTLTSFGIPIWDGIPEKILKDLHTAGYKIKKRKSFKRNSKID